MLHTYLNIVYLDDFRICWIVSNLDKVGISIVRRFLKCIYDIGYCSDFFEGMVNVYVLLFDIFSLSSSSE